MSKKYVISGGKKSSPSKGLKKQVTVQLDYETIEYFKTLADEIEIPYLTLINLYLRDCADMGRLISIEWKTRE